MNGPSIDELYGGLTGYQHTAALKAGIELDLFTAIAEGADAVVALAARCGASERGVRSLCDYLTVHGLLTRDGERYALGATAAAFLDRRQPTYVGSAVSFIASPTIVEGFNRLTEAVRRGGSAVPDDGALAPEHPVWVEFARAMAPLAAMTSMLVANFLDANQGMPWRVLDVAAGHGMFGITLARENPRAEIVALDWANVLEVARENAVRAGVADRVRLLAGSAFDVDWGTGYDLVLLPNFLHHFDVAACERLLARAHAALAPGGRVLIVEFVPDDDRRGPQAAVSFGLVMLAGTPGGDAYTFHEYEGMLRRAGFAHAVVHDLVPTPQRVIVASR